MDIIFQAAIAGILLVTFALANRSSSDRVGRLTVPVEATGRRARARRGSRASR